MEELAGVNVLLLSIKDSASLSNPSLSSIVTDVELSVCSYGLLLVSPDVTGPVLQAVQDISRTAAISRYKYFFMIIPP